MKKIQIKGKDYIEVNERIKEFHKKYPDGSITTDLIEMTDRFITKTTVIPDATIPERKFTGIAYEKEDSTFINKTSALENCETSSVGRALGMLGIGIDTSIASYDEVANAVEQQKTPDAPPKVNLKDQEVPNPEFEKVLDDLDGMPMDDGSSSDWDGDEVCRFGKYRDVKWNKIVDAGWIEWVSQNSKVDWQRDLAKKELRRRGV
jgi:hypothetical protein